MVRRPLHGLEVASIPRLLTRALAVGASGPTTGPTLPLLQLLFGPANSSLSCRVLLGVFDPADEFVASQRGDVLPRVQRRGMSDQFRAKVRGKFVHHPARYSLRAHVARVIGRAITMSLALRLRSRLRHHERRHQVTEFLDSLQHVFRFESKCRRIAALHALIDLLPQHRC